MNRTGASSGRASVLGLVAKTLVVTPSGALSPGPLSAAAIAIGAKMGVVGGIAVAAGHMAFEAPYLLVLTKWLSRVEGWVEKWGKILNAFVIIFIAFFSYLLLRDGIAIIESGSIPVAAGASTGGILDAFITGIILTGANAYFLLWWLTVGLPLIQGAAALGPRGFTAMYAAHVWMDYVWLALLAEGGAAFRLLGALGYGALLVALAALLLLFAADIASRSYAGRRLLPL